MGKIIFKADVHFLHAWAKVATAMARSASENSKICSWLIWTRVAYSLSMNHSISVVIICFVLTILIWIQRAYPKGENQGQSPLLFELKEYRWKRGTIATYTVSSTLSRIFLNIIWISGIGPITRDFVFNVPVVSSDEWGIVCGCVLWRHPGGRDRSATFLAARKRGPTVSGADPGRRHRTVPTNPTNSDSSWLQKSGIGSEGPMIIRGYNLAQSLAQQTSLVW